MQLSEKSILVSSGLFACGLACSSSGCIPDVGAPSSLIKGPRVLALRSEPAEAAPLETVRLQLYAVAPSGPVKDAEVEWAFCAAPKPPVENNAISDRCLGDTVREIGGRGPSVTAQVPEDACALFGPQLPPSEQSPRPRDADSTGGYYQPVRARSSGVTAIGLIRIRCGLASATPQAAAEYRARYVPNRNPEAVGLTVEEGSFPLRFDALPADKDLTLRLVPEPAAAEDFLVFNPSTQTLQDGREQLRVSWFASAGSFAEGTTAVDESGEVRNVWRSPSASGPAFLWAVLRDSRGGVSVLSQPAQLHNPR